MKQGSEEEKRVAEKSQESASICEATEVPVIQMTKEPPGLAETPEVSETEVPVEITEAPSLKEAEPSHKPTPIPAAKETKAPPKPTEEPKDQVTKAPVVAEYTTQIPDVTEEPRPLETPIPEPQVTDVPVLTQAPPLQETAHIHEFEKAIWELPTCQKGGYYNNICKTCGVVEGVSVEPLPHETEDVVVQEGNCMEDRVIRHVCKICGVQTESDTRYPLYDEHLWGTEEVDGMMVEYCERCGVVK